MHNKNCQINIFSESKVKYPRKNQLNKPFNQLKFTSITIHCPTGQLHRKDRALSKNKPSPTSQREINSQALKPFTMTSISFTSMPKKEAA